MALIGFQRIAEQAVKIQDTLIMEELRVLGLLRMEIPMTPSLLDNISWLTNATLDDLPDWQMAVLKNNLEYDTEQPYPLTTREQDFIGEGGHPIPTVPHCDLILGHSGILDGTKVFLPCVEFHFRNDATRHAWGTPVTLETDLPKREPVTDAAYAMLAQVRSKLSIIGGQAELSLDEYEQTKDRHILWLAIPTKWVCDNFKDYTQFVGFLEGFCG
jgi:hypothetical protein